MYAVVQSFRTMVRALTPVGAFVVSAPGGGMVEVDPDATPEQETLATIDFFLDIVASVRAERHRDPLRAVEDVLLDLRGRV